jgi:two-component system chemotaxis response regulator CheB
VIIKKAIDVLQPAQGDPLDVVRVMIVDDSLVVRGMIARLFADVPDIEVAATVSNGQLAVDRLSRNTDIDVIVMDIEMPVMDGLTALPKLLEIDPRVKIIMASTLSQRNAEISLRALAAGATDYVPKPSASRELAGGQSFAEELQQKVRTLGGARRRRKRLRSSPAIKTQRQPQARPVQLRKPGVHSPEILAIGSSTGGPQALFTFLSTISTSFKLPIVITQHMPATFTAILAEHITRATGWPCSESKDGDVVTPGRILLAPGDFHMVIEEMNGQRVVRLNQEPPVNFCRPAVDVMLRSLVSAYGPRVLAVILTGMGSDGLIGGQQVVEAGGTVIAQDEATSIVWGMPGAVATADLCSTVLPLGELGAYVMKFVSGGAK